MYRCTVGPQFVASVEDRCTEDTAVPFQENDGPDAWVALP